MANMARITSSWQNWPGAPGVTVLYADPGNLQPIVDGMRVFWENIKVYLPTGLTITVASSGDLVNDVDGKIQGAWSVPTAPAATVCSGAGSYAGNAGAVIHWLTIGLQRGRRIRGRTFVVPLVNVAFDTGGSLAPGFITALQLGGTNLLTAASGGLRVWARPLWAKPKTTPPTMIAPGTQATVTSVRVPDLAVSLRSRRI